MVVVRWEVVVNTGGVGVEFWGWWRWGKFDGRDEYMKVVDEVVWMGVVGGGCGWWGEGR